jgi:predicted aldo/keto reductase-like oxidoreductase
MDNQIQKELLEKGDIQPISRRTALKYMGASALTIAGIALGLPTFLQSCFNKNTQKNKNGKMATRTDKTLGAEISLLGFGCMRLPVIEAGKPDIDEAKALEIIDYGYQHGINYFDTAYFYHQGMSETLVGKALKRYPRESFYLADKMPTPRVESLEDAKRIFEEQLQKCQVDYFDFYLLHSIGDHEVYNRVYEEFGVYEYLKSEKEKGRIKRLGFSFHSKKEDFPYLVAKHQWDFTMIQANYLDWETDGEFLYNESVKHNLQCIIMEPVRGGALATLNEDAVKILKTADPDRSPASWAIQWIASKPEVLTVLSGMSNMEQVIDNVQTMSNFEPMTAAQCAVVDKALKAYLSVKPVPCTECKYCMPCPAGVDIPGCFHVYNKCITEGNLPGMTDAKDREYERKRRAVLANMEKIPENQRPNRCTTCGVCVPKCPQSIAIADKMKEIATLYRQLMRG